VQVHSHAGMWHDSLRNTRHLPPPPLSPYRFRSPEKDKVTHTVTVAGCSDFPAAFAQTMSGRMCTVRVADRPRPVAALRRSLRFPRSGVMPNAQGCKLSGAGSMLLLLRGCDDALPSPWACYRLPKHAGTRLVQELPPSPDNSAADRRCKGQGKVDQGFWVGAKAYLQALKSSVSITPTNPAASLLSTSWMTHAHSCKLTMNKHTMNETPLTKTFRPQQCHCYLSRRPIKPRPQLRAKTLSSYHPRLPNADLVCEHRQTPGSFVSFLSNA